VKQGHKERWMAPRPVMQRGECFVCAGWGWVQAWVWVCAHA